MAGEGTLTRPIGVIDALSAGYRIVARAWPVWSIPLALDLVFWLGPQVTPWAAVQSLMSRLEPDLQSLLTGMLGLEATQWATATGGLNLLALITLGPGAPSTLASTFGQLPPPPWQPLNVSITSPWALLALLFGLPLLGTPITGLYLAWVTRAVQEAAEVKPAPLPPLWRWITGHMALYTALLILFVGGASVILSLGIVMALLVSPTLAALIGGAGLFLLSWALLAMWLFFYFTPAAVALHHVPLWRGLVQSASFVWHNLWGSLGLVLLSLLIAEGFALIWQRLFGSWPGALVALVGNAYLTSGLTTASFVFYFYRARQETRSVST